jgi:hypothetical protein
MAPTDKPQTACLAARSALIALRKRGQEPRLVTVIFPARWRRSALLSYVRREHPKETARIVEWHPTTDGASWEPRLWLANPAAFSDYRLGKAA